MNPIIKLISMFRGYNKPVTIYKKVGNNIIKAKDVAKGTRSKFKTRKLMLYEENVSLPYPPSEAMKNGRIILYSPSKDKFAYCKEELDLDKVEEQIVEHKVVNPKTGKEKIIKEKIMVSKLKITTLDSDIVFWLENEIYNAFNKYKSDDKWWQQYVPYIMVGVFLFIFMIVLCIGWFQIVQPALEVAKGFTTMAVTCDVAGLPTIGTKLANATLPLI